MPYWYFLSNSHRSSELSRSSKDRLEIRMAFPIRTILKCPSFTRRYAEVRPIPRIWAISSTVYVLRSGEPFLAPFHVCHMATPFFMEAARESDFLQSFFALRLVCLLLIKNLRIIRKWNNNGKIRMSSYPGRPESIIKSWNNFQFATGQRCIPLSRTK